MNAQLVSYLKANLGTQLTSDIAADIMVLATQMPTLIPFDVIDRIKPVECQGFSFAVERMAEIAEEIKPLHLAHWNETEAHRHDLPFNPDYQTFIRYERAGRYVLFTMRDNGKLLGNCAMYLSPSAHTQTMIATEDTLFLLPEARRGTVAKSFVGYVESGLRQIGANEINITVKTMNRASIFFKRLGYRHVENGFTKILENANA